MWLVSPSLFGAFASAQGQEIERILRRSDTGEGVPRREHGSFG
jgi:hypothetical protein